MTLDKPKVLHVAPTGVVAVNIFLPEGFAQQK